MFQIKGVVESGRQLGRKLGFPTANVAIDSCDVELESGVYLSRIEIGGEWYDGVTNIGTNPTVGVLPCRSESYIFDFDGDIYGQSITIELRQRLRSEIKFDSVEALRKQISIDVAEARAILK